jgi:hypothetical protein
MSELRELRQLEKEITKQGLTTEQLGYIIQRHLDKRIKKMNHIMLDIETLGTDPSSVITSVGAVVFNESKILARLDVHLPIQPQLDRGRTITEGTILFWLKQSEEARQQLIKGQAKAVKVSEGLKEITAFFKSHDIVGVWGNGVGFDNVMLKDLYQTAKMPVPWAFWMDADYRTIKNLWGENAPVNRVGVFHNGVDDAETQAVHLIAINKTFTKSIL